MQFEIENGATITFTVITITNTIPVLELFDDKGSALDITGTTQLAWKAPSGGEYYLAVSPQTTTFGTCPDVPGYELLAEMSPPGYKVFLPIVTKVFSDSL